MARFERHFIDSTGKPMVGLTVQLAPAGTNTLSSMIYDYNNAGVYYANVDAGFYDIYVNGTLRESGIEYFVKEDSLPDNGILDTVLYADLYARKQAGTLVAGQKYLISDYQSFYTIPWTTELGSGSLEPLIVTAISINQLSSIAQSSLFPKDVIHYDIENNQGMVPGCTKGYIYRRIDTVMNNDICFDWRQVKFRRWQLCITGSWAVGTSYSAGALIMSGSDVFVATNASTGIACSNTAYWLPTNLNPSASLGWANPMSIGWVGSGSFGASSATFASAGSRTVILPISSSYTDFYMFAYGTGSGVANNYIASPGLELPLRTNTVFFSTGVSNNKIGPHFHSNNIFGLSYCTINGEFFNNHFAMGAGECDFGTGFKNNLVFCAFGRQIFKTFTTSGNIFAAPAGFAFGFNNNIFRASDVGGNFFAGEFYGNFVEGAGWDYITNVGQFKNNFFGGLTRGNVIRGGDFLSNIFTSTCSFNEFGGLIRNNNFGPIMHNKIGNGFGYSASFTTTSSLPFQFNEIPAGFFTGINLTTATLVYGNYTKHWARTSGSNTYKLIYMNDAGALTASALTV